jgi:hypothetical protein
VPWVRSEEVSEGKKPDVSEYERALTNRTEWLPIAGP